jgi:hypothetical protein
MRNALSELERHSVGVDPMIPKWDGYVVRALNKLASLTRACRLSDYNAARIKTSPASRARKKQSSDRRNRRNHITGILILLLTLAILRKIA